MHEAVSDSILNRVRILNKKIYPWDKEHYLGEEPQSLVFVSNIPDLNLRSLHSGYDVKANVLLIAICQSNGDVKPGGPLGPFRKEYANASTLAQVLFITHTLHIYTHPRHLHKSSDT